MKQYNFSFLLTILMSTVGTRAFAYNAYIDGIYYDFTSTGATVTYFLETAYNRSAYKGSVVIPESVTYGGKIYTVTRIGYRAFYCCSGLTSITIPNSVTSIDKGAFDSCSGLTSITIPNSVTIIGSEAFSGCSGLTSITILNSVTSIGDSAFEGTAWYNNLPDGLVYVGKVAYKYKGTMPDNTSITIEDGTLEITGNAFLNCIGLSSITIPNSVIKIGDKAFYNTWLKSVTIGTGVLSIGSNIFGFDSFKGNKPVKVIWLTNTPPTGYSYAAGTVNYVANDSYTSLNNKKVYSFLSSMFEVDGVKFVPVSPSERTCDAIDCAYNESVENINIGKTVSYQGINLTVKDVNQYVFYQNVFIKEVNLSFEGNLGDYAFQDCTDITKVVVNNEGSIGSQAFYNSTGLKTLDVGVNVKDIGSEAFKGCTLLETAKLQNQGLIGNNAFQNCTAMTTTTLGENLTSIGQYAFSGCSSLKSITIPDAVTSIGNYSFGGCTSMASMKMGTGVTTIGTYAFSGCSALADMQIGNKVETIGSYAFRNCSALPQIVVPQSVTKIDNYAFSGCTSLANINMEDRNSDDTALTLGSNGSDPLFSSCPLDEVYIGRNISYSTASNKGYSPFYRNTSLKTVTITNKETEISPNEFYGCTSLKNVTIGDGVTTIGNWAFSGCSSLDYFACGSKVANIGKEAFSDCTAMTKLISRAATPPVCGAQALDDINKWNCKLQVPEASIPAYQAADQWKDFFFIEPTGINEIKEDTTRQYRYYDLNGNLLLQPHKGVNILKSSNGKTKKVLVK